MGSCVCWPPREGARAGVVLNNMRDYVAFLNTLHNKGMADVEALEGYWIDCVHAFFASIPFRIKLDPSRGLRHVVRDILEQAVERQKEAPGMRTTSGACAATLGRREIGLRA